MPIEYHKGNLLTSPCQIIIHQCNCFHTMGAGIARQIKSQFPKAFQADKNTLYGNASKLGTFSCAEEHEKLIVNLYSQYNFGKGVANTNYIAMRKGFYSIIFFIESYHEVWPIVGMPRIGCGLAGGRWEIVEGIILDIFEHRTVRIYDL